MKQVFSHNSKFLPLIFSVIIAITRDYMSVYKDIFFQINFDKCKTVYTSLHIMEQVFSHNFKFVPINTPLCILRSTVVNEYAKNQYQCVGVGNDNNTSMLRRGLQHLKNTRKISTFRAKALSWIIRPFNPLLCAKNDAHLTCLTQFGIWIASFLNRRKQPVSVQSRLFHALASPVVRLKQVNALCAAECPRSKNFSFVSKKALV